MRLTKPQRDALVSLSIKPVRLDIELRPPPTRSQIALVRLGLARMVNRIGTPISRSEFADQLEITYAGRKVLEEVNDG